MKKTENYQLNQWEAEDTIRREDFNADNAAIDAAIAAVSAVAGSAPKMAYGYYTGPGGNVSTVTLNFDFEPKFVLVELVRGVGYSGNVTDSFFPPLLLVRPVQKFYNYDAAYTITVTWGEKSVTWSSAGNSFQSLNTGAFQYYYIAFG